MSSELSELEKLYSPSYWSKRFNQEEIMPNYIETITKLSEDVKKTVPCQLDVSYGSSETQKLDIYGIDLPKDSPIFLFIHGGYWQEPAINRQNSCFMAKSLYENKCKVAVVGYTLCPHATLFEIIEEIKLAVRKTIAYAQEHGHELLVIGGHSVGAHLAMCLFPEFYNSLPQDQQELLKAVFLIGGIYDLTPLITTTINDPLRLSFNLAQDLSPLYRNFKQIASKKIKFLVIVGENDSPAFVKQSELFYNTLNSQGIECYLQVFKELDHFDIVEKMHEDNYEIVKLILESVV